VVCEQGMLIAWLCIRGRCLTAWALLLLEAHPIKKPVELHIWVLI
jgi:hypothetical protein